MKIKKDARIHNQSLSNSKKDAEKLLEMRQIEVSQMRQEMDGNVERARYGNQNDSLCKADMVRQNLNALKEQYKIQKKEEQQNLAENYQHIKGFEKDLQMKLKENQVIFFMIKKLEINLRCRQSSL